MRSPNTCGSNIMFHHLSLVEEGIENANVKSLFPRAIRTKEIISSLAQLSVPHQPLRLMVVHLAPSRSNLRIYHLQKAHLTEIILLMGMPNTAPIAQWNYQSRKAKKVFPNIF